MLLQKYKAKQVSYVHNIWTEGVFVTQLSNHAGISVRQTVWVIANFCFMRNI
jgi:hypothetical protein